MVEKVLQLNREKYIFWMLLCTLFLFIGFYMYFVRMTISNVVIRQNLEHEASRLTLDIGNKEFLYITKRNTVNIQLAYSLGFRDTANKSFISRDPSTKIAYRDH
ncbi:MAG TPA: hypothetical protein VJG67_00615 [Candidatus Paceibacterota bacterium]